MAFIVPQFIERETRIAGPFTFKQLVFVVTAGGLSIFFYFTFPFYIFLPAAVLMIGSSLALAFWRIEGLPLPVVIKNFFVFLIRSKIYLWKKKVILPKIAQKKEEPKEAIKESSVLKVAGRSKIGELQTFLEAKSK